MLVHSDVGKTRSIAAPSRICHGGKLERRPEVEYSLKMLGNTFAADSVSMVPGCSEFLHMLSCAIIVDLNRTVAVALRFNETLPDEVQRQGRWVSKNSSRIFGSIVSYLCFSILRDTFRSALWSFHLLSNGNNVYKVARRIVSPPGKPRPLRVRQSVAEKGIFPGPFLNPSCFPFYKKNCNSSLRYMHNFTPVQHLEESCEVFQRLTLSASLCAFSPAIAVHLVLPQRLRMLSFRSLDSPRILRFLALSQRFCSLLLMCCGAVRWRVMCFQYSIHGVTVITCMPLATWALGSG